MRPALGRAAAVIVLAALGAGVEGSAAADEKGVCSAKYQSAQRLRAAGKLTLARADLLRCAEQACPAFVSNDCKTWLAEVEADLPTLVYAVLDPYGRDVPSATIRVDGTDVPNATDGLGHPLDPGEHVVDVTALGQALREKLVVRVGEKSRRIELRFGGAPSRPSAPDAAVVPAPGAEPSRTPTSAFVLGGLAVVAIASGSVLWVTGSNAAQAYNRDCETTGCTYGQHDAAQRQLVAGDVAWGVGVAAGIGALAIFLSSRGGGAGTTVSLGPATVSVSGTF